MTGDPRGLEEAERDVLAQAPVAPVRIDVDTPCGRLSTLSWGEGPAVVLLHPLGFFAAMWASMVPRLAGHRVVAIDAPGHGRSCAVSAVADLRRELVATYLAALDALEVGAAVLVGNSLGGMTALWLALAAPDRVRGLAVLGVPAVALRGVRPDPMMKLLVTPIVGWWVARLPAPDAVVRPSLRRAIGPGAGPQEALLALHRAYRGRRGWAVGMRRLLRAMLVPRALHLGGDELSRIAIPCAFVWGRGDPYGPPAMASRAVAERMPAAWLREIDGGHVPHLDAPDVVAAEIERVSRASR